MALRSFPVLATAIPLILAALIGGPAQAQTPDFGDDSSRWAHDGECDDPRFEGEGMATFTSPEDEGADASDCRAAFEAGRIRLIGGTTGPAPASPAGPADGSIPFGDDSSQWAQDGECDDRRFAGPGMATSLSWEHVGRDATDCRTLHEAGQVRLWDWEAARAATDCAAIDFGDDASEYANTGLCDDPRFEGFAMDGIITANETGHDASDCRRLCEMGAIALRDY